MKLKTIRSNFKIYTVSELIDQFDLGAKDL